MIRYITDRGGLFHRHEVSGWLVAGDLYGFSSTACSIAWASASDRSVSKCWAATPPEFEENARRSHGHRASLPGRSPVWKPEARINSVFSSRLGRRQLPAAQAG